MTYFGQQKKKLNEIIKKHSGLGPGTYSPQKQDARNQSYAPFGSLLKKQNIVKDSNNNKEGLGPGTYNINRQIIKPSILHYENQNCIIIKINQQGCSQFKSKIERFNSKNVTDTPGPGSYIFNNNEKPEHRRRTKSVGSAVYKMKELYNNQYVNRRKPTLTSDKPSIPQQEAKPKQTTKGILKWSLDKKQRFKSQPKQTFKQQDKSILLDKANMEKKKEKMGVKQSSFFASKSVKSSFDQMIYKTSNPFKVEIRKMLGFEDRSPGPGTYNCETQSISQQKKPLRFQFFGSTVQRFQTQQGNESTAGPGYYQLGSNKQLNVNKKQKKIKSFVKKPLSQPQDQDQNVGPGTYSVQNNINSKISFNRKYNSGAADFGSRQPRFQTEHQNKRQQKSQYISFMAQQDQQKKKRIQQQFNLRRNALKNKKHCVFASQTKRFQTSFQQVKTNNPFGFYEVGVEDIGNRIRKQKQYDNQFSQCNLSKPGFLSSVQRFKTQIQDEPSHVDCWCLIKQVQKKNIDHLSPSFQSNSKKLQVFDVKIKGPPVGQYSKSFSLIKQSFNSRFIKQNQNKTKKIKIWKDKQQ